MSRLEFFIFRDRLGSTFFAALQQLFFGQVIIILTLAVWKDAQGGKPPLFNTYYSDFGLIVNIINPAGVEFP